MSLVRAWYNGYNWLGESVYNPFDVLLFISKGKNSCRIGLKLPHRHSWWIFCANARSIYPTLKPCVWIIKPWVILM
nr:AAA family ATPase [Thiothrix fructosivorans]